jgi:hypothetical protein
MAQSFDPNGSIDRREMERKRQRAVLITIDYDGVSFRGDDELFRGRAVVINAPQEFAYGDRNSKVVHIDREISGDMVRHGRMPIEALKNREFRQMEVQLLEASREMAAHGPEVTLIPMHEYRGMQQHIDRLRGDIDQAKFINDDLSAQNTGLQTDVDWHRAKAQGYKKQRDAALGSRARKLVRKALRWCKL